MVRCNLLVKSWKSVYLVLNDYHKHIRLFFRNSTTAKQDLTH
jgi:hypothetical protein